MTREEQLLAAIGRAEDRFLEELEQPPLRRLPRHFGLIAALLALLLTACAAPAVIRAFDKLENGGISGNGRGHIVHFYSRTSGSRAWEEGEAFVPSDVELEVSVDPDAPGKIETCYLPLKLLDYCQIETYTSTEAEFSLTLSMKVSGDQLAQGIFYRQYPLPKDGHMVVPDIFGPELGFDLAGEELEQTIQSYGDITALEFSGELRYRDENGRSITRGGKIAYYYTKYLFWSDGFYLYCLKVPLAYPLNVEKIEEVLTSLTAVDDIREYLPPAEA